MNASQRFAAQRFTSRHNATHPKAVTRLSSDEPNVDTWLLYQRLLEAQPGETVTYPELAQLVGRPVSGSDGNLRTAIERALQIDDAVFGCVVGIGYRRLTDSDIVRNGTRDTDSIRRRARRAGQKLTKIQDFEALDPRERVEHNARLAILAAIGQMTQPASIKAVEDEVGEERRELPFAETIAAFQRMK